jgi:hypothetical protein
MIGLSMIAPADVNVPNVQEFAERAWRSVNKEITVGKVTVRIKAFGR